MNDFEPILVKGNTGFSCRGCLFQNYVGCILKIYGPVKDWIACGHNLQYRLVHKVSGEPVKPEAVVHKFNPPNQPSITLRDEYL